MASVAKILSRQMSSSAKLASSINNVTIIGGGLMGSGIAQVAAQTGYKVTLVDINKDVLDQSKTRIETSLGRVVRKLYPDDKEKGEEFTKETLARLKFDTDASVAVKDADLVVEAVVENMDLKHKIFSAIDSIAPQHAIFASNTSSFLINDIAKVTKRLDRCGGLHFFNPVPVMKLVEVIKAPDTSEDTHKKLMEFGTSVGKTAVEAKDKDGFIVNRLFIPYLVESVRMLERGDATAKDIDAAMKLGLGHPMGPLELIDYTGLDTCKFIMDGWRQKDPTNPLFASSPLLDKLVSEGKLGVKTGEGFYVHKKK